MGGRIYLSSPPTGLDAYSQNALELPDWVMPLLSPGLSSPASGEPLRPRHPRGRPPPPPPLRPTLSGPSNHGVASSRRHLAVQTISGGSGISTGCPSPTTYRP